jgi:CTP synthase (UTP-ammonia lyase)
MKLIYERKILGLIKPVYFQYQVVPHITDEIQDWIECVAMNPVDGKEGPPDVCVIELGGTIGEQNIYFK